LSGPSSPDTDGSVFNAQALEHLAQCGTFNAMVTPLSGALLQPLQDRRVLERRNVLLDLLAFFSRRRLRITSRSP